jgi:predicted metal-dependent phosphoesterase TrpH
MKIDLHTHTTYSDGRNTPKELIDLAKKFNYDIFAITDHDSISGFLKIKDYAKKLGIKLIPGVEISSLYNNKDIHILAYFFDFENKDFLEMLAFIQNSRQKRALKIIEKLNEMGKKITIEEVTELSGKTDLIGRPHIARALIKNGYCRNVQDAFYNYLGNDGPAYYPKLSLNPKEVIEIVKKAGGISVVAHPFQLENEFILLELIEMGVQGIEVFYRLHTKQQIQFYSSIADKYNLIKTGGSDYHGDPDGRIIFGDYSAPNSVFEQLLMKREKIYETNKSKTN